MSTIQAGKIVVTLEGKDVGLSTLIDKVQTKMNQGVSAARAYNTAIAEQDATTAKAERQKLQYAAALAKVAQASGDSAGSIRILASALDQVTPNTIQAQQALARLQTEINKLEDIKPPKLNLGDGITDEINKANQNLSKGLNFDSFATQAIKAAGFVYSLKTAFGAFNDAIKEGVELDRVETMFRTLSGSTEKYEKNLALAKEQQERFGGSLKDTLDDMSGFVTLSNNTGISLDKLANTARAMSVIDPAQGFKGASIALKEFFSGDITSLARRFEIPRADLNAIKSIEDADERFKALTATLAKYGITQELVDAQAQTSAAAYDRLVGSVTDLQAALGQLMFNGGVTDFFAGLARGAAEGITSLANASAQIQGWQLQLVNTSASADQFNAKTAEINDKITILGYSMPTLTEAQFQYAKSLAQAGADQGELAAKLAATQPIMDALASASRINAEAINEANPAYNQFVQVLAQVNATGANGAAVMEGLIRNTVANIYTMEEAINVGNGYIQYQTQRAQIDQQATVAAQDHTVATQDVANATTIATGEILKDIEAKQQNAQDTAILNAVQKTLAELGPAVANGLITAGDGALILAQRYGIAQEEGRKLLEIQAAIAQTSVQINPVTIQDGIDQHTKRLEAQGAAYAKIRDAQEQQVLTTGTAAQKQETLNKKLERAKNTYGQQSVEFIRAQTALKQFQQQQDKAATSAKKAGGGGAGKKVHDPTYDVPKLTTNEKLNTQLLDQQQKFDTKFEDQEIAHLQKIRDIYDDHAKKVLQQQSENEVGKRRSKASFYAGLTDLPTGIDPNKFAAQYEQAFSEAQTMAQQGKARLSKEFLDLRQSQIEEMKQLDIDAANITNDKDLSKKDKQSKLEYLNGRRGLVADAQKEELDQLLKGGDSLQTELQGRLDDENKAYADQVGKIAKSAGDTADAKIAHAERSKIAVDDENTSLATQLGLYDSIGKAASGVNGSTINTAATTDPNTPQTITADTPIPIATTTPLPVQSTEGLVVRQLDIWLVRDQDVINSIGDMTARLEGKLGEVVTAIGTAKDEIKSAVGDVTSAVGKIKIQTSIIGG